MYLGSEVTRTRPPDGLVNYAKGARDGAYFTLFYPTSALTGAFTPALTLFSVAWQPGSCTKAENLVALLDGQDRLPQQLDS